MFTPFRARQQAQDSISPDNSDRSTLILKSEGRSVLVDHDGFTIGSSARCDLVLRDSSVTSLHSVIHIQSGATWIEAADDDNVLLVNDHSCRRMTLRHQDRLNIGASEFTVMMEPETAVAQSKTVMTEDLALLTAEELCDRILAEQSMVAEFAEGQQAGWEALLRAIDAAHEEATKPEGPVAVENADDMLNELLGQIQELNQTITDRTRELSDREAEIRESTSVLEQSQQQVAERIDQVLEQLNQDEPPSELRASA